MKYLDRIRENIEYLKTSNNDIRLRLWILENPRLFAFNEKVICTIHYPEIKIINGICKDVYKTYMPSRMHGYHRCYNVEYNNKFIQVEESDMIKME
jgi:hypothetical protein